MLDIACGVGKYSLAAAELIGENGLVLSISELGYGKRTAIDKYRKQTRGGKGIINVKTTKRVGKVIEILPAKGDMELMIITIEGKIIRIESAHIRKCGRGASGVRLVRMSDADRVAAACIVPEPADNGDDDTNKSNGQGDLPLQ